jgi:hypothetical protein
MTLHWIERSGDRQISVIDPTIELLREVVRERPIHWVTA